MDETRKPDRNADCVFVVGAGRGGTSAVTRLINLLGVPLCAESDLLEANGLNPTGYWESTTVMVMDDIMINLAGGRWWCPPAPERVADCPSPAMRALSAQAFRELHPVSHWLLKDPRLTITAPYWIDLLGVCPVMVIVVREPAEVVRSVQSFGVDAPQGYALWERYMRTALHLADVRPAIVVELRDVLARPDAWCEQTADFLRRHGFALRDDWQADVREFLRPAMLRPLGADRAPTAHTQLLEALRGYAGHHHTFHAPSLPDESDATTALIAAAHAELSAREGRPFPEAGRTFLPDFWTEAARVWDELCTGSR